MPWSVYLPIICVELKNGKYVLEIFDMSETMHIENMFARIATLKLKTTRVKYT